MALHVSPRKLALVIGNSRYDDPALAQLTAPVDDVNALAGLLRDAAVGGFDAVRTLLDQNLAEVQPAIADFFAERRPDDLLLLYFSGHGVLDERGRLYLAVMNTRRARLSGTAVPAAYLTDEMDNSRSRRQVLILDCCHSGAFARGTKAATGAKAVTLATFEGHGYGRTVLTATDATQFAWEGDQIIGQAENSLFTHFLVEGLRTGEADENRDGRISLDEWYDYAFGRVVQATPRQTPGKWSYKQQGEIYIAQNPRFSQLRPADLPLELIELINSRDAAQREAAVRWLGHLLAGSAPGPAAAARQALKRMAEDDSRRVAAAAARALGAAAPEPAAAHLAEPKPEAERRAPAAQSPPAAAAPAAADSTLPPPASAAPRPAAPAAARPAERRPEPERRPAAPSQPPPSAAAPAAAGAAPSPLGAAAARPATQPATAGLPPAEGALPPQAAAARPAPVARRVLPWVAAPLGCFLLACLLAAVVFDLPGILSAGLGSLLAPTATGAEDQATRGVSPTATESTPQTTATGAAPEPTEAGVQPTAAAQPTQTAPAAALDDEWIAYAAGPVGVSEIQLMRPDGSERTQLTDSGFNVEPAWSPDGRRLAFVSTRDGDS
jgi:uncharacterized caspase-like protein